jgi:DNA-binding TFAR19-related protein (PDSD5 family)
VLRYILEARELPILSMFDRVKNQMMTRHYSKGKEAAVMTGILTPKIKKKLDKNIELANNSFAEGAGDGLLKLSEVVCSTPTNYIVDLKSRTCTCKR